MKIKFEDLINKFIEHITVEKNLSLNTSISYRNDVLKFIKYINSKKVNFMKINEEIYTDFLLYLKKNGYSASSICRIVSSIRNFYKFMVAKGYIKKTEFEIETPKIEKKLPEFLTEEEVEKILSLSNITRQHLRNLAILELFYSSGLRISELCNLKIEDFNFEKGFIKVKGKGGRERLALVNNIAIGLIKRYLSENKKRKCEYVFVNNRGERISRQSIWKIVKKYAKYAGLEKNVTPHTFRHSFATHLLSAGMDLRFVQELLGHKSIATTEIYTHLNKRKIKEIYKKLHPRA